MRAVIAPAILLVPLLLPATAGTRLFAELDVGLPGKAATAVAISPDDDAVVLAAVEGLLLRSPDSGDTWSVVLRTSAQTVLPVEDQLELEDAAQEAAEDEATAYPGDFAPDLEGVDLDAALEDLEEDLQETLAADRETGVDTALPEGDVDVGTDARAPRTQELPGIRRVLFVTRDVVLAATHAGLFQSADRGVTFQRVQLPRSARFQDVRDVSVDPASPAVILVATRGGALWSADAGATWTHAAGPAGRVPALACALSAARPGVMAVGTRFGLARSADGGKSFEVVLLPGEGAQEPVIAVTVDHAAERLYAVTPHLMYAGAFASRMLSPVGAAWRDGLAVVRTVPGRPGALWAAGKRGIFVSTDGGRTGAEMGEESMVRDVLDLAVSAKDPDVLVAGTVNGVYGFVEGGVGVRAGMVPVQRFRDLVAKEPTPQEVAGWAVDAHRADPGVASSMARRSRLSALGPRVVLAAAPPTPMATPHYNLWPALNYPGEYVRRDNTYAVTATATWPLARLFASEYEVNVRLEHRRLMAERERVWKRVLRTYEARRRLQATIVLSPQHGLASTLRRRLRLLELNADLDAETGGRFTQESRRRGGPEDGVPPPTDTEPAIRRRH